jgi:hypothetical protein
MLIKTIKIILFSAFFLCSSVSAQESCSRTAIINQQEVLVDANSTQKGEGLRYYLEKDKIAYDYLKKYQDGTKTKWYTAALGTVGTTMIISSFFVNSDSNSNNKQSLIIGGATAIIINFLMSRTLEASNEKNLDRAIQEYNKRNLPRIEFNQSRLSPRSTPSAKTVYFQKNWSF